MFGKGWGLAASVNCRDPSLPPSLHLNRPKTSKVKQAHREHAPATVSGLPGALAGGASGVLVMGTAGTGGMGMYRYID